MLKIYQKYFLLFSFGLLFLFLFVVGCGWFVSNPNTTDGTPPNVTAPSEPANTESSRQKVGDPDPAIPESMSEVMVSTPLTENKTPEPTPKGIIEDLKHLVEMEAKKQQPVEPPKPVIILEPEAAKPEESVETDTRCTGKPVDQDSPVDETSPVNTESPVNDDSPVQGGDASVFFFRLILIAILVLQDEQPQTADSPHPTSETDLPEIQPEQPNTVQTNDAQAPSPPSVQQDSRRMPDGTPERSYSRRSSRSDVRSTESPPEPVGRIRFNFRYAPWKDVIEWFAEQAALSLQADNYPSGTFNKTDGQYYTPTEALDILNSYLLFKEYSLLRKGNTLFLIPLSASIPPNLLEPITANELDTRGTYEICQCVFDLNRTTPEIIQAEAEKLLGPQGSILLLPKSQQIVITETSGKLRTIRDIIKRIDDSDSLVTGAIQMVEVKNLSADEALQMMRRLLVIDEADPSLQTVVDSSGKKILLSGRGDMIERAKDVINRIEVSFGSDDPALQGQPQFEIYDAGFADPATVFAILQTLLAGTPDTRLSLDTRTGGIAVLSRPANHATVREAIRQMQLNVPQVDTISLKRMSPLTAVESIKKFFATSSPLSATSAPQGRGEGRSTYNLSAVAPPTVEADLTARQIIVRGTITQIAEIRALLAKLGEDGVASPTTNLSTIRTIPLSPAATSLVLEQLQTILPNLDPNIKVVIPTIEESKEAKDVDTLIDETFDKELPEPSQLEPPMTQLQRFICQPVLAQVIAGTSSEVVVSVTPAGIVITSDNPEALRKLEEVIRMLSDETILGKMELRTYRLTHSTATVVSPMLQSLMGTGSSPAGVTGAGSVDLPEWQQSEVLGLLSAQINSVEKTGTITISVDERLNSLYILANLVDHKTIEKLLKILDQPGRDDIMNRARPRLVQLINIRAEEAKTVVETIYANRMQNSGNNSNRSQLGSLGSSSGRGESNRAVNSQGGPPPVPMTMGGPSGNMPQEMLQQAMESMRGRSGSSTPREQEPPMTLGIDPRTNSLIVSSSESLFLEVKAFVETLDAAALQTTTVMVTESLVSISPDLVRQTISNLLGDAVKFTTNRASQTSQSSFSSMGMGGVPFGSSFRPGGMISVGSGMGASPFGSGIFGGNNPFMNIMRGGTSGGSPAPPNSFGNGRTSSFGSGR